MIALWVIATCVVAWLGWRWLRRHRVAQAAVRFGLTRDDDGMFRGRRGATNIVLSVGRSGLRTETWISVSGGLPEDIAASRERVVGHHAIVAMFEALGDEVERGMAAGWSLGDGTWSWQGFGAADPAALLEVGVRLCERVRTAYAALPAEAIASVEVDAAAEARIHDALIGGDENDPAIRDVTDVVVGDTFDAHRILPQIEWAALMATKPTTSATLRVEAMSMLLGYVHARLPPYDAMAREHLVAIGDRLRDERGLPTEVAIALIDVVVRIDHPRTVAVLMALREGAAHEAARAALERVAGRTGVSRGALAIVEVDGGLAIVETDTRAGDD